VISRIHQKLGTAGFIISIVALVAALCGGAYAAGGGLSGKQKKEVTKIAKKYAGKPGAPGATGPQGLVGAAGAKGDKGDKGDKGETGGSGAPGADGKSVEAFPIGTGQAACSGNGGTELEVEGSGESEEVCNGSPWTAGGTLPSGATETGTWSASGLEGGEVYVPISFPIPLESESSGETPALLVPAGGEGFCTGTNVAPTAPAGKLCIYKSQFAGATSGGIWDTNGLDTKIGRSGAFLILEGLTTSSQAFGTWAVTAP
jgi:hypothetical protein